MLSRGNVYYRSFGISGDVALLGMRGASFVVIIHPTLDNTRRGGGGKGHYCPHGMIYSHAIV